MSIPIKFAVWEENRLRANIVPGHSVEVYMDDVRGGHETTVYASVGTGYFGNTQYLSLGIGGKLYQDKHGCLVILPYATAGDSIEIDGMRLDVVEWKKND